MTLDASHPSSEAVAGLADDDYASARARIVDPDAELVRRAQAGDERAFAALMVKYQQRIARRVARYVKRSHDVEDVVQEIFIKAYRGLASFKSQSAFYTWLYRIATNAALNFVTRQRNFVVLSDDLSPGELRLEAFECDCSDGQDPERLLLAKTLSETVERAVARMQPDLAEPLLLYEVEGKQYKEITQLLQVPIGTVRTRIFRARAFIGQHLEPVAGCVGRVSQGRAIASRVERRAAHSIGMPT